MNGYHGRFKGNFRLQPVASKRWKLVGSDVFMIDLPGGVEFIHTVHGGTETDLASVPIRKLILFLILVNQGVLNWLCALYILSDYPGNVAWGILGVVWALLMVYVVLAFPSTNDSARAAIHHDLMYREQLPRHEADRYFYHGLRVYIGSFWATVFWLAVRLGGWHGYARYKKTWDRFNIE